MVRDSLGILIVENSGAAVSTPMLRVPSGSATAIGLRDDIPAEQFSRIGGVTRLSDGTVVVLETTTAELRFFDSAGAHVRTAGGVGDGPGELRSSYTMARLQGDTIAVWDGARRSLVLFTSDAEYQATVQINPRLAFPDVMWSRACVTTLPLLPSGGVLSCLVEPGADRAAPEEERVNRRTFRLAATTRSADRLDTLGLYRGVEHYILNLGGGSFMDGRHPFMSSMFAATSRQAGRLYLAQNPEYSIEVWTLDGRLEQVVRRLDARRRPSREEIASAWDDALAGVEEQYHARVRSLFSGEDPLPAIHGLATGPGGELWVKREPVPTTGTAALYDVFSPAGEYHGSVGLPTDINLVEIGTDYMLGVATDEFDVLRVEMYRLERTAG